MEIIEYINFLEKEENKSKKTRKNSFERKKIKNKKLKQKNIRNKKAEEKLKKEKSKLAKKELKEKQIYKIPYIKIIENIERQRQKKKKNKLPNEILINNINKNSINIYDEFNNIKIYGKAAYIIEFFLKDKKSKYKDVKKIKTFKKKFNKNNFLNYIILPMLEKNYIIQKIKENEINYFVISKRLNYEVLEKAKFKDNKFKKTYKEAKKYKKREAKMKNLKYKLENLHKNSLNEIYKTIQKYLK